MAKTVGGGLHRVGGAGEELAAAAGGEHHGGGAVQHPTSRRMQGQHADHTTVVHDQIPGKDVLVHGDVVSQPDGGLQGSHHLAAGGIAPRMQDAAPTVGPLFAKVQLAGVVAIELPAQLHQTSQERTVPGGSGWSPRPGRTGHRRSPRCPGRAGRGSRPAPMAAATPPWAQRLELPPPKSSLVIKSTRRPGRSNAAVNPATPLPTMTTSRSTTSSTRFCTSRAFTGRLPAPPPACVPPSGAPAPRRPAPLRRHGSSSAGNAGSWAR